MKVQFQGKEVEANEIEVLSSEERWNSYQLADGKLLLLKVVLTGIQRLEGIFNPDGTPTYQFQTTVVSRVKN